MTAEVCSEACAGSAYYGTQYSTEEISSAGMTAEICSAACAGSAYYGTQYSIEPTAALAEDRVAAPAAPAPLRAAPRSSSPPAPFAPTPGPPRASSKFLPSLLDVTPRYYAHLARQVLPTNRATVSLLLRQSWRNSAQLVSIVSRPLKTG
ncbi:imm upregulated 8 [Ectocarpus siliculosus]|uniref:Imm upregulated 8 n=1 Tax=Ectocarpus siliculosus TaxID=2880 RepID=D7FQI0_ECTSI|nr:imm upregulated 8 [Ectocarpus siliculosus]|eukprot:CBJ30575.1 imm upregulated 8 [Ectocarpus siliculosus]